MILCFSRLTITMADTSYVTVNVDENGSNHPVTKGCWEKFIHRLYLLRTGLYIAFVYLPCILPCNNAGCDSCILPCFRDGHCCDQDNCWGCGPVCCS